MQFAETKQDAALRKELTDYAETHGTEALHERLKAVDPAAAAVIHPNNVVRVVRALEVALLSGQQRAARGLLRMLLVSSGWTMKTGKFCMTASIGEWI